MSGFFDPADLPFTGLLERAFDDVLAELQALGAGAFVEAPDSLTTVEDGYDERGWRYFDLVGGAAASSSGERCPRTMAVLAEVPGLVNAGFSRFAPGTHLYPHRGELAGVLRCHLALVVPPGDLGIRIGDETRRWETGRCIVFDDTLEHTAWNHAAGDRVVLLVTFARPT